MASEIIQNESNGAFTVNGLNFSVHLPGQPVKHTTADEIVILKPPEFLRKYDSVLKSLPSKNIVEVGIAEGGSLIYFALAYPDLKFTGIDLRAPNPAVQDHIKRLGLQDRISIHYRVNQADVKTVRHIIRNDFGDAPLGAVIDDASHFYAPSRTTFETLFPLLAHKGTYCLEDWSWAHEAGPCQSTVWMDQDSLSNLLFQIIMLQASTRVIVGDIRVDPNVAFIERGPLALDTLSIEDKILLRGKHFHLI